MPLPKQKRKPRPSMQPCLMLASLYDKLYDQQLLCQSAGMRCTPILLQWVGQMALHSTACIMLPDALVVTAA